MSKRYTNSSWQRQAAASFLRQSEILSDSQLLERCQALMENTVMEAGMIVIGSLLEMSVARLTGDPHQGREGGEFFRHGYQPGAVYLGGSKLRIERPRVRAKAGKEVKIPAYETLRSDAQAGAKVMRAAVAGVSTRNYGKAVEDAALVAGISKSNVSRRLVEQTAAQLKMLMERPVPADLVALMMDGIRLGDQVLLCAIGIDRGGKKHALGVVDGTTENSRVACDLLRSLTKRGLDATEKLLFVTDGSKALRAAIKEICGDHHEIQRCREHKIRNVTDRVSKTRVTYIRSFMRGAWKLPQEQGMAKMRQLAKELEVSYPDAARSVLEGLEDTFTVNRLGLPPLLVTSLQSTNIIESSNGTLRNIVRRIKNPQSGRDQALRWGASALLEAENGFRVLRGHKQIWMLAAALGRAIQEQAV